MKRLLMAAAVVMAPLVIPTVAQAQSGPLCALLSPTDRKFALQNNISCAAWVEEFGALSELQAELDVIPGLVTPPNATS